MYGRFFSLLFFHQIKSHTSADQDTRFSNKHAKLMKSQKFPPELKALWKDGKVCETISAVGNMEQRGVVGTSRVYYELACCLCCHGRWREGCQETGHLTFTSPRAMLVSQRIGTAVGRVVASFTFFLFYNAFDIGNPNGEYKAPYALVYRNMAILGVEGFSALPDHCLELCYGFFVFAIVANLLRDITPKIGKYMPLPMAMAVPFLVGGNFAIDMSIGSAVVFAWNKMNKKKAELMVPAVAFGLMCGDGLWVLPASFFCIIE